jgi:hypothetical protein
VGAASSLVQGMQLAVMSALSSAQEAAMSDAVISCLNLPAPIPW